MKLDDVIAELERIALPELALPDDPIGLLIQPEHSEIRSIVVCLDCTSDVARAAAASETDLIIAHHPLLYHPMRRIDRTEPIGSITALLVKAGIGLFAMHTNWDAAEGGINDTLAATLELKNVQPLSGSKEAYLGRIGALAEPRCAAHFAAIVADLLHCSETSALRCASRPDKIVQNVAVCGGAGAMLVKDAIATGADALVTGDVRHHEFIDSEARGLLLIDAGHEATEVPGMAAPAALLKERLLEIETTFLPNQSRI